MCAPESHYKLEVNEGVYDGGEADRANGRSGETGSGQTGGAPGRRWDRHGRHRPWAGMEGAPQDYVTLPVGHHEWCVAWQEPDSHTLNEALVLNFANRTVYNHAPGSDATGSAGALPVVERDAVPLL